jgi:glycosyltransferase involved in cell wall biosynthesis
MVFELLAAMSRLSADAMLLIVGGGEGQRRVEEQVAALDLGDRVRVAGSVTEEEKRCYYAAADAFVYPNPSDRPFLVVLEAQACGLPVVAMANRCNPFVVQDGRTGLLARDFDELVAHLASLAADRERCCSMGRAAREYVASAHSIETRAREFEELLLGR